MNKESKKHLYIIYKGQWRTKDCHTIAEYQRRDCFIRKIKSLGYEKYWGAIASNENTFQSTFGDYHIMIF